MWQYPFIVAWGRWLRSNEDYIQAQVARAQEEGAPLTAIQRNEDGWGTLADIQNGVVLSYVTAIATDHIRAHFLPHV